MSSVADLRSALRDAEEAVDDIERRLSESEKREAADRRDRRILTLARALVEDVERETGGRLDIVTREALVASFVAQLEPVVREGVPS